MLSGSGCIHLTLALGKALEAWFLLSDPLLVIFDSDTAEPLHSAIGPSGGQIRILT